MTLFADSFYFACEVVLLLFVVGWDIYSSQSSISWCQRFDTKAACGGSHEKDYHTWDTSTPMVPTSPAALFGGATTGYTSTSQKGLVLLF